MTSSLVGSEMCIRDRFLRSRLVQRIRRLLKNGETGRATTALLTTPTFETVSYTHLTLPTICSV
eukprot:4703188-Prorocentrum_lima.AAC.1